MEQEKTKIVAGSCV